jgi:hypothetical protein
MFKFVVIATVVVKWPPMLCRGISGMIHKGSFVQGNPNMLQLEEIDNSDNSKWFHHQGNILTGKHCFYHQI